MKAEHRHELKTNALAEWLTHFPDWARENLISIIIIAATIIGLSAFFFFRSRARNAGLEEQQRFTGIVNQVSNNKMGILQSPDKETDQSFLLFAPVEPLEAFANSTNDGNLAAFSLIKKAEAVRSQLHYRTETVSKEDVETQIGVAKQSYARALERSGDNAALTAAAKFGLGLCEEELGNFEEARKIYADVAENEAFEGTVTVKQAELRLETMGDYKENVVFMPKPKPEIIPIKPAKIDLQRGDPNKSTSATQPKVILQPADTNAPAVNPKVVESPPDEPNKAATQPQVKPATVEPEGNEPDESTTKPTIATVPLKGDAVVRTGAEDANSTPKVIDPNAGR